MLSEKVKQSGYVETLLGEMVGVKKFSHTSVLNIITFCLSQEAFHL